MSQVSGKRFAIALISWLASSMAVVFSVVLAVARYKWSGQFYDASNAQHALHLEAFPLTAWICLGVMTFAWLRDKKCHPGWVVLGSLAGLISVLMYLPLVALYVSSIPLALYLVYWHGFDKRR